MKYIFSKGDTSLIVPIFIRDSSSSTGAGLGSLDQTSNIVGGYLRPGSTGVALAVDENVAVEGTYGAPTTAGQVRIGTPANMRSGTYELHFHNDLFAAGNNAVFITLGGAANMADLIIEIQLGGLDLNDDVRGGMTALPNAAADAAGGLPISDAGGLALDTQLANTNEVTAARMGALTDWINGGRLDLLLDAIKAVTDNLPESGALTTIGADTARLTAARAGALTDWIDGGRLDLLLDAIKAVTDNLPDAGALTTIGTDTARLTAVRAAVLTDWIDGGRLDLLLDAIKAVTDLLPDAGALTTIGTDTARLTAVRAAVLTDWIDGGRLDLLLDAIKVITDAIGATGTGLSAIPWNAAWDAEVESEVNDALDTAISELGVAVPIATPTIRTGLMLLYMALRCKLIVQTSGTDALEVHNDAGTKIASKLLTDAGGDYTEAKMT